MKPQRVNCADCIEFEFPRYGEKSLIVINKAKCKLGKRVMFRLGKDDECYGGWFRYCNEFNDNMNEK
jgi:hypothetical protein